MNYLQDLLAKVKAVLEYPLFKISETQVTLWTFIYFVFLIILLFYIAGKLRKLLVTRLLARTALDIGARQAIAAIIRYAVLFLGLLVIVQSVGINLTTLNVLAGVVGIGIGFGLQNIASNFISGLIILFERPIRVGDRIVVGGVEGDVTAINARATTVLSNDNVSVIVPNSKFITEDVINWSYEDRTVRIKIPVSVAYGSDIHLVTKLLLEVAKANKDVLAKPEPVVRFIEFGDNGLLFELRPWTTTLIHRKGKFISAINYAIYDAFTKNNIEFPYPQRDLRIRGGQIDVRTLPHGAAEGEGEA